MDEPDDYMGCVVFRKEEGGRYKPLNSINKESKYKTKSFEPGTTYYYQVRAYHKERGVSRSEEEKFDMPKNSDQ